MVCIKGAFQGTEMGALTQSELEHFASLLDLAEQRARTQLATTVAAPPSREPSDQVDQADRDADSHMGEAVETHARMELADIAAARRRLADQSFGTCVDCGEDIPQARLLAYPTAKRCMACQRLREAPGVRGGRR